MTAQDFQRSLGLAIREATKTVPISDIMFYLGLQQSLLFDAVKISITQQAAREQAGGIVGPNGVKLPPGRPAAEPPPES